tara:strand:+ start:143 stop:514 length:372 start_codon:yes stop_codon:yes gene_type:complete
VLYKSFFDAQSCNIEERRDSRQFLAIDTDTDGGAGKLLQLKDFLGEPYTRARAGYIKNDEATNPIIAQFKFSTNPGAESFTYGIMIRAGEKLDLYPYGLISEIYISNYPKVSTDTRAFRMFAT